MKPEISCMDLFQELIRARDARKYLGNILVHLNLPGKTNSWGGTQKKQVRIRKPSHSSNPNHLPPQKASKEWNPNIETWKMFFLPERSDFQGYSR